MRVELDIDEQLDAGLPIEKRRPTLHCFIEVGDGGPVRYRHERRACVALVDTGASLCAIRSNLIPRGLFPIAFNTGSADVAAEVCERAVYWTRISFANSDRTIEFASLGHDIQGASCNVVLGTPFLAYAALHLDIMKGERHLWIHGN